MKRHFLIAFMLVFGLMMVSPGLASADSTASGDLKFKQLIYHYNPAKENHSLKVKLDAKADDVEGNFKLVHGGETVGSVDGNNEVTFDELPFELGKKESLVVIFDGKLKGQDVHLQICLDLVAKVSNSGNILANGKAQIGQCSDEGNDDDNGNNNDGDDNNGDNNDGDNNDGDGNNGDNNDGDNNDGDNNNGDNNDGNDGQTPEQCKEFDPAKVSPEDIHEVNVEQQEDGDQIKVTAQLKDAKKAEGKWELMAGLATAENPAVHKTQNGGTSATFTLDKSEFTKEGQYGIAVLFSGTIDEEDCQWGVGVNLFNLKPGDNNNDDEITTPEKQPEQPKSPEDVKEIVDDVKGGKMPDTSSHAVNSMLLGTLLLTAGAGILFFRRKQLN
ncbi:LPXTG cell wall anchor domain-containing protein [Paludifilum halophilum]|uniref:Gram-positive cocci surface proteins LPxTG domain-containing protein n=1 Tax=Paludifilum halophilum TaxID=1642702 RepID=A0A235BAF5_9BACL|nr:LPXTG cell wall anchor domain-containing protein [Paludifilum halophilum]OYD08867.1 hypothetical protein CHM34_03530 [Paludifilum halophilum]